MYADEIEKDLEFLAISSEDFAKWKSREKFLMHKIKHVEASGYLGETGSIENRKQGARASKEYVEVLEDYRDACYHAEVIGAKREACRIRLSMRQTLMKAGGGDY